jgi:hypothetical protein
VARAKRRIGSSNHGGAEGRSGVFVRHRPVEDVPKAECVTAVAAEALRSGFIPTTRRRRETIPHEVETICAGDPDDDALANEYVGENTPGGSTSTPDQGNVDDIGRIWGLQEEDTGALRSSAEVLERRDRRRSELQAPRRPSR